MIVRRLGVMVPPNINLAGVDLLAKARVPVSRVYAHAWFRPTPDRAATVSIEAPRKS